MGRNKVNTHHSCVACGRQFIEGYEPPKGYSDEVKREGLKMYVNGMGFPGIERGHRACITRW